MIRRAVRMREYAALMMVVGAILLAAAVVLAISTESALRRAQHAVGGEIHNLGAATAAGDVDGELVRISGVPRIVAPPSDTIFGITADAPALLRTVKMLQWREIRHGARVPGYQRDWIEHAIDSSGFAQPQRHKNLGYMPFRSARFDAADVRIGGLQLAPALVHAIPGRMGYRPALSTMPPNLAATFRIQDGTLRTSRVSGSPQLGDLRVSWSIVPKRLLTVLALAQNGRLVAAPHLPGHGFAVFIGDIPLEGLLPGVPRAPRHPWAPRGLALALAIAGVALLVVGWRRWRGAAGHR